MARGEGDFMDQFPLIASERLEGYFYEQLNRAFSNQGIQANPHTEFYLVQLLTQFTHTRNLYREESFHEVPLAIRYLESLQSDNPEAFRLLKQLADFTLYISGFFQESLFRKKTDLGYYVNLGGNAYHRLHEMIACSRKAESLSEAFGELSCRFSVFADALCEINENSSHKICKNSDLLRLYEKWLMTGSERIKRKLQEFGIYPDHAGSSPETQH